jgi:hypothetical protein
MDNKPNLSSKIEKSKEIFKALAKKSPKKELYLEINVFIDLLNEGANNLKLIRPSFNKDYKYRAKYEGRDIRTNSNKPIYEL